CEHGTEASERDQSSPDPGDAAGSEPHHQHVPAESAQALAADDDAEGDPRRGGRNACQPDCGQTRPIVRDVLDGEPQMAMIASGSAASRIAVFERVGPWPGSTSGEAGSVSPAASESATRRGAAPSPMSRRPRIVTATAMIATAASHTRISTPELAATVAAAPLSRPPRLHSA